jgi:hypothetical protein
MIRIVMSTDEVIEVESIGENKQKYEITNNDGILSFRII